MGLTKLLAVDVGGHNEETYSKYSVGARIKQLPSRRQQQRLVLKFFEPRRTQTPLERGKFLTRQGKRAVVGLSV